MSDFLALLNLCRVWPGQRQRQIGSLCLDAALTSTMYYKVMNDNTRFGNLYYLVIGRVWVALTCCTKLWTTKAVDPVGDFEFRLTDSESIQYVQYLYSSIKYPRCTTYKAEITSLT